MDQDQHGMHLAIGYGRTIEGSAMMPRCWSAMEGMLGWILLHSCVTSVTEKMLLSLLAFVEVTLLMLIGWCATTYLSRMPWSS